MWRFSIVSPVPSLHVINEEEIRLRPGELLFMNQHIEHAVIACGQEDLGINIIIRPAYFQNILT